MHHIHVHQTSRFSVKNSRSSLKDGSRSTGRSVFEKGLSKLSERSLFVKRFPKRQGWGSEICIAKQYINGHSWHTLPYLLSSAVRDLHFFRRSLKPSKADNLEWISKVFYFCMAGWDKADYAVRIRQFSSSI